MPVKINVPYNDKDVVKSKGAFWDVEQKTWFIPDHKDINDFQQWIDKSKVSVIIKSPLSIALNSTDCYKCGNKTAVISLASNNFYYLSTDEKEEEKWFLSDNLSFFSMPTFIDAAFSSILSQAFPNYKITYSKTAECSYWANHCEHCEAFHGDFFLHSEPGGAFFPLEIEEYGQLTFITISSKFDVEINADYSWLSHADDILNYTKSITLEDFFDKRK